MDSEKSLTQIRDDIQEDFEKALLGMLTDEEHPHSSVLKRAFDTARAIGLDKQTAVMYACVELHKRVSRLKYDLFLKDATETNVFMEVPPDA